VSQTEPVSVRILDREYTVGVDADERDSLHAAARMLDAKMREIRGSNRMAAVDRVAVLAALNLPTNCSSCATNSCASPPKCSAPWPNSTSALTVRWTARAERITRGSRC
jgi:Uncharacterized protein conserved in bacteria